MGGTWRDNTYPGAACDVPTHLYSFSFEPRSTWDRLFSQQPEIFDYLKEVGAKYGLYRHVTFNTRVTRGYWDEDEYRWHVFTDGDRSTSASSSSPGWVPCIFRAFRRSEGLDRFEGPVFHSAQWNHDYDLTGKKVAVIGTGASAIQFVPEIVGKVGNSSCSSARRHGCCRGPMSSSVRWPNVLSPAYPGCVRCSAAACISAPKPAHTR